MNTNGLEKLNYKSNENVIRIFRETNNSTASKHIVRMDGNYNLNCNHSRQDRCGIPAAPMFDVTGKSPCDERCLSEIKTLPSQVNLSPLSIDVTTFPDPYLWDHKYVSEIVDLVVQHFRTYQNLRVRWHKIEYDSMTGPYDIHFGNVAKYTIYEILRQCQFWFYHKFCTIVNSEIRVDQFVFDAAVFAFYHHHKALYYTEYLVYQLAVGITMFAIYSTGLGFSDALYHAVHLIEYYAKTLKRDSRTYPSNEIVSVYTGSVLMTPQMIMNTRARQLTGHNIVQIAF